jgi:enoyl-CoA hydratase/carnithine racemase
MDFISDVITIAIDGHVATVWLDRPDKLNAMNLPMWNDLPRAIGALGTDADVRVVIIAGKGRAFTAGIDLEALVMVGSGLEGNSEVAKRQALYQLIKKLQHTMTSIADCPKPVIAAVHGHCVGAGVDLITACDIRFASPDATFSVRETKLGMVADVGTMQRLPKVVAPGYVAELAFTGKDFSAQRAREIGLVNDVHDDVHQAALDLAEEIAANSPLAVQGAKAVLKAGENRSIEEALDYMAVWNAAFLQSNDLQEAMLAHLEKRPPEFKGE